MSRLIEFETGEVVIEENDVGKWEANVEEDVVSSGEGIDCGSFEEFVSRFETFEDCEVWIEGHEEFEVWIEGFEDSVWKWEGKVADDVVSSLEGIKFGSFEEFVFRFEAFDDCTVWIKRCEEFKVWIEEFEDCDGC